MACSGLLSPKAHQPMVLDRGIMNGPKRPSELLGEECAQRFCARYVCKHIIQVNANLES